MTNTIPLVTGSKEVLRKLISDLKSEFNNPKQKNLPYVTDHRVARNYDTIHSLYQQINDEKYDAKGKVAKRKKLAREEEVENKNVFQKLFFGWKKRMETKASIRRTKKLAQR